MKVKLQVVKHGAPIFENDYHVTDAASFGRAFADLWMGLREAQLRREPTIGALMDHLDADVPDQLNGAHIRLYKG
jgi:hypothetical protein